MNESIEARLADRVTRYLLDPPRGDDSVVRFASPQQLQDTFATTVGLPLVPGAEAAPTEAVMAAVESVIDHSIHTVHPRFLNQNFAGPDPVSVVGDWLGAALNTTGATFEAAPVFTLMESAVLQRLAALAGYQSWQDELPVVPPGMFCPGGSTATLYALQLARFRLQPDVVTRGADPSVRPALFVSAAGHYAARKSASLLGIGSDAVIQVDTDESGALSPAALEAALTAATTEGLTPMAVIATAGTTVTSAFDDIGAVADICQRTGVWLHVDGAYGGSALFSPRHAHLMQGVERSDSFVWNLHKMMGMTQQCTALLIKEPERLAPCFATSADYLFQPDKQYADYDSGDRTFQCARRVDVLKLWLTWKVRGEQALSRRVEHAVEMADLTRSLIAGSDGAFSPLVAGTFTNVVFSWIPPDMRPLDLAADLDRLPAESLARLHRLPPLIKATMQQEGTAMVGFQPIRGLNSFRMLFMNPAVQPADVEAVLGHIDRYGHQADQP